LSYNPKTKNIKISKIALNNFQFSHIIRKGSMHLYGKSEPILPIIERYTELGNYEICLFPQLLYHKTFYFQFRVLTLINNQNIIF